MRERWLIVNAGAAVTMTTCANFKIKRTIYSEIIEKQTQTNNQSIKIIVCATRRNAVIKTPKKCASLTCPFQYRKSMPNIRPFCVPIKCPNLKMIDVLDENVKNLSEFTIFFFRFCFSKQLIHASFEKCSRNCRHLHVSRW